MCGIIGSVSSKFKFDESVLNSISHRGPDDCGFYDHKNLFLGHTRLSIQDLSMNAHQPMYSLDNNFIIIFNGEIYNHNEIRETLPRNKYIFKSSSDTETILYGFIEFGEKLFNMLNGIFSIVIFNKNSNELFIVRDHFGVKPLYYYLFDDVLLFGSEIKSFLKYPNFNNEINYESLLNYNTLLWCPGQGTPFENVKKLLPGSFIKVNINDITTFKLDKFYTIPFKSNYKFNIETTAIVELEKRLIKAVKRQLLSDVPVAFFLSGGIDSSCIVALAKQIKPNERLRCYTINNTSKSNLEGFSDDLYYARKVAEILDVDLIEVQVDNSIIDDFDKMIYHLDEPQADLAPLNVYYICKKAKEDGYKVLLGGTAGDDLFSGYRRHKALSFEKYIEIIPRFILRLFKKTIGIFNFKSAFFRRIKKAIVNIDKIKFKRQFGYFEWLSKEDAVKLFKLEIKNKLKYFSPSDFFMNLLSEIPDEKNDLNKMLYWELNSFLVDHNLNYTDKLSMAAGVEVRVPFLDIELVEFSTMLNPNLKIKKNQTKYILKKLMENYLPKEIIYRSKAGFGSPIREWVMNDSKCFVSKNLEINNSIFSKFYDYKEVVDLIEKNKKGEIDASYPILALISMNSWTKQFLN